MQRPLNANEVEDKRLNVPIQDVLVVEDSPSCIESLEHAIRTVIDIDEDEDLHVTKTGRTQSTPSTNTTTTSYSSTKTYRKPEKETTR